jgi:ParB family chromosome partitioning protein
MAKLKGLGRGLDALLASDDGAANESLHSLPIDRIGVGKYQPRTRMDEQSLAELADSIKAQGIMQPILVRPLEGGRYELIAGERRWRAAQRAGLSEIPALVRSVPDQAALALALIENIQREDLNPLEEAQGIARLISEFRLTHDAAAAAVGRSRSAVSNLLRLTQLPKQVQGYVHEGKLDMGHARALLALSGSQQMSAAARVVAGQMSVRDTERMVRSILSPPARRNIAARPGDNADTRRLQDEIAECLGAKVRIDAGKKGAGKIVIDYSSLEQLDGILSRLRRR